MSTDVVIRAEGLGKKFVIGHQAERESYVALRDVIARGARNLARSAGDLVRGRPNVVGDTVEEFWALRGLDFEVRRGEVVGVIGRNGAGKSTLLKILSRITEPTEGRVEIKGRVASLLEVGTGFHPELTGRENIHLNGAILGMTRAEIRRKFDEIVAFAEVEKFLDTPVKRYSSGMYVRLAFAVAAHLEPEILIIDEVLAVGDAEFQKKCLGKMGEVASHGRTVLFVSHNMASVRALCAKGLLLEKGRIVVEGEASAVISAYVARNKAGDTFARDVSAARLPAIHAVRFRPVEITDDDRASIELSITATEPNAVCIDVRLKDDQLTPVGFGSLGALQSTRPIRIYPGETHVVVTVDTRNLANGAYYLSLDLAYPFVEYIDTVEDCIRFEVLRPPRQGDVRRLDQSLGYGSVDIPLELDVSATRVPAAEQSLAAT